MQIIERSRDLNLRQVDILKSLLKETDRYFSIAEIKGKYNVVYDTARNDMQYLAELDYIEQVKRGRSYLYRYMGVNR